MSCFSEACERNKDPILEVLKDLFATSQSVLEVGSGTGQHAVWFARQLPNLIWHASDREVSPEQFEGLTQNLAAAGLPNLLGPYRLDVAAAWPEILVDAVFTANTLHIMAEAEVTQVFAGANRLLVRPDRPPSGTLCVYGPFNRNGQFTSPGNASLDAWVKRRFPQGGIKDLAWVLEQAEQADFSLIQERHMPANNLMLIFKHI